MFLHTYYPQPILLQAGFIKVYWYGFFITLGMAAAFSIADFLVKKYNQAAPDLLKGIELIDLLFYLIIGGIIGARLGHVLSEYVYYWQNPLNIFKFWNGGLSIYGGIAGGICGISLYKRKIGFNFKKTILLFDILAPGLVIGQAIGRWGNYFNQELYGLPTNLSWGIPIVAANKVELFSSYTYFHPTFLYESLWCVIVGIILLVFHENKIRSILRNRRNEENNALEIGSLGNISLWYLFLYSGERFIMEFLRVDPMMIVFNMRLMQMIALLLCLSAVILMAAKNCAFKAGKEVKK